MLIDGNVIRVKEIKKFEKVVTTTNNFLVFLATFSVLLMIDSESDAMKITLHNDQDIRTPTTVI